jgi:hypothetical protein
VAQLFDLAAVGVVEVLDALLSVRAFKLNVCSGGFALGGQRRQVASQLRCRLPSTIQVSSGSPKLALHLLYRCLAAICALRFCLGAALGCASTPFCLGPALLLSVGPFDRCIMLLL